MSKIERLKEELAIQKQLFFLAIALVIGILGWLSTNSGAFPWWIGIGGLTAIVFASLFAYFTLYAHETAFAGDRGCLIK